MVFLNLSMPTTLVKPTDMDALIAESGESSFQTHYAHLLVDIDSYSGNIDLLLGYVALVINMFVHIATFTPSDGHGKAQLREFNHHSQLQYFRSQGHHVSAKLYKALTKTLGHAQSCRLPFNEGFMKLISAADFLPSLGSELKKIDYKTGYVTTGEKVSSYVMTDIAHAGARKNNMSTLMQGLKHLAAESSNVLSLKLELSKILPPTKKILRLEPQICVARIRDILGRFKTIGSRPDTQIRDKEALSTRLLDYRIKRVKGLQHSLNTAGLKHIVIDASRSHATFLMIRLYPGCTITDDTYKEGVTNVLLSFFGALLNHYAAQKGLKIHTERRQSFGFFRPTLTDAGGLTLRLSLGLESKAFDTVIADSLKQLDKLLEDFRFNDKTDPSVRAVFEYTKALPTEEPGKRKTRAPDTFIRNIVRKDNEMLTTYHQAKAYIDNAYAQSDVTDSAQPEYLNRAMASFLDQYVCKKQKSPLLTTSHSNTQSMVELIDSPLVHLLENILTYTASCMNQFTFAEESDALLPFVHVCLHSLEKLFLASNSVQYLLTQVGSMDSGAFYCQGLALVETLLEHLIFLNKLQDVRALVQGEAIDPIKTLHDTELAYTARALAIPKKRLHVFFADSGQQAITTTLLILSIMLHGPAANGVSYDQDIHLFAHSYYEVAAFIKDCKKAKLDLEMKSIERAKIIFIDVAQLEHINLSQCLAMKALVIDTTNYPLLDQQLKHIIDKVHKQGGWVVLVESCLKHGQLGLDKYQAGKMLVMAPPKQTLAKVAIDLFERVSEEAIDPAVASYLSMVHAISRAKKDIATSASVQERRANTALAGRGFSLPDAPPIKNVEEALETSDTRGIHKL